MSHGYLCTNKQSHPIAGPLVQVHLRTLWVLLHQVHCEYRRSIQREGANYPPLQPSWPDLRNTQGGEGVRKKFLGTAYSFIFIVQCRTAARIWQCKNFLYTAQGQWAVSPSPHCSTQPPNRRRNPNKSANKSADRFFAKTGSQCAGSQSQAPNIPSFGLLCRWSHVETQYILQFSGKKLSLSLYMVPEPNCESFRRWYMPWSINGLAGVQLLDRLFLHFLSRVLMRKLVFYAQTKRR